MNGLSIDEVLGEMIKKELVQVVEKQFGSRNIKLCVEPGSKKGKSLIWFQCFQQHCNIEILNSIILTN